MGAFVPQPKDYWIPNPLDPENPNTTMSFVQFVPGIVVKVVTGVDSVQYAGQPRRVGSIIAKPHYGDDGIDKTSFVGEENRYYPLLRGIQETPSIDDPVLLAKFGGVNYYLGPLNTEGSPNYNKDKFSGKGLATGLEAGQKNDGSNTAKLFVKTPVGRLEKRLKPILDAPINPETILSNDIHGDMLFEGRHGNSVRIGSRNINPYIIISNGRNYLNSVETSLDGTIFGIFKNGTIREHFSEDYVDGGEDEPEKYEFTLADDELDTVHRSISKTFSTSMGRGTGPSDKLGGSGKDDEDITKTIYGYHKDQVFLSSGRITFNSRDESMFLASKQFMHFGSGNNITFSTSNTFLVDSATSTIIKTPLFKVEAAKEVYINGKDKITLGNPEKPPGGPGDVIHAAVLGDALVSQLGLIVTEVENLALATSAAIEGRKLSGDSVKEMNRVVKALQKIMGTVPSTGYPQTLSDLILSKKVYLKV